MAKRITIGNTSLTGFVNHIAEKRIVIGTGSYNDKSGNKVFKESVTVFLDENFDGAVPAKGDFVTLSTDLSVSVRPNADELQVTANVRFANQLVKTELPTKKGAAPAKDGGNDDGQF